MTSPQYVSISTKVPDTLFLICVKDLAAQFYDWLVVVSLQNLESVQKDLKQTEGGFQYTGLPGCIVNLPRSDVAELWVPDSATEDEARATFWVIWDKFHTPKNAKDKLRRPLSSDCKALLEQIRTNPSMQIQAASGKKILDFVQGWVAGTVFTLTDVPPDLVGMVFMPLGFGGMSPPEDAFEAVKQWQPGKAPTEPVDPVLPAKPADPKFQEPDKVLLNKLRMDSWSDDDLSEYEIENHLKHVEDANADIRLRHEAAVAAWEKECQKLKDKFEKQKKKYKKDLLQHQRQDSCYRFVGTLISAQYSKSVGTVYADTRTDQVSPRSVNGYPCFFSMQVLSADDLQKAKKLIAREQEHLKEQEALLKESCPAENPPEPGQPEDSLSLAMQADLQVSKDENGMMQAKKEWTNPDGSKGSISCTFSGGEFPGRVVCSK